MDPRLLPIAPFLYFGKRYRRLPRPLRLDGPAQRSAFNLWRMVDGTLTLHRPDDEQILRPAEVAISGPGTTAELATGTSVHHLAFDLVYRPRYTKQSGCVIDVRMPKQPSWEELFDRSLPTALPTSWCQSAVHFVDLAEDRYWRSAGAHLRVNAHLHMLLARLIEWQLGEVDEERGGLVHRAETLIQGRAHLGITVTDLAGALQVSRPHLSRRFAELRGIGEALRRGRLEHARHLLECAPEKDVGTVAVESGFSSASVMRRAFVRELGLSPAQWRRRANCVDSDELIAGD